MQSFQYCVPTKIIFGKGAEEKVGSTLKEMGYSRVFIVFGGGSVKRSGLLNRVEVSLEENGIIYEEFGGAMPNPTLQHACKGIQLAIEFAPDFILAVGGGSAIDTAKAIAHGVSNPDVDIWRYWQKELKVTKSLPIGSVLTIPAAGSETSDSAVLTDMVSQLKVGLSTPFNVPKLAFMNPELALTLPRRQVINGVVDIMMHTLDRYFEPGEPNELTDGIAEAVLRTVISNGEKAVLEEMNYQNMSELMWCGSISHNSITGLGKGHDFSVHALGRQFGALYNCDHGATLSAVWSHWAYDVCDKALNRFSQYARKVWDVQEADDKAAALKGIKATEDFFKKIGAPVTIKEMGVNIGDAELLDIAKTLTKNNTATVGLVSPMTQEDIFRILKTANQ